MRRYLQLHPDSRCDAVGAIAVDVTRPRPGTLMLHYELTGVLDRLRLPPVTDPVPADELWRHTCFEAFVRVPPEAAYREFNFSPSTQWAAYRFTAYRCAEPGGPADPPHIAVHPTATGLELHAALRLNALADAAWQLGLSAVIEEANGRLSYWALKHVPGKPDFHNTQTWAAETGPPQAS
jgi:hypothetical protein